MEQAIVHANVGHPQVAVVLDLVVGDSCAGADILISEEVEPEAVLGAGPLALRVTAVVCAFVELVVRPSTVRRGIDGLLSPGSALQGVSIQPGVCQTAGVLGHCTLQSRPNQRGTAGPIVEGPAHLDVVHIEDAVVALVLIPPVWQSVTVLVGVDTVDERVAIEVDVKVIVAIVWAPLHENIPVHLGNFAVGYGPVVVVVAVVVEDEIVV